MRKKIWGNLLAFPHYESESENKIPRFSFVIFFVCMVSGIQLHSQKPCFWTEVVPLVGRDAPSVLSAPLRMSTLRGAGAYGPQSMLERPEPKSFCPRPSEGSISFGLRRARMRPVAGEKDPKDSRASRWARGKGAKENVN